MASEQPLVMAMCWMALVPRASASSRMAERAAVVPSEGRNRSDCRGWLGWPLPRLRPAEKIHKYWGRQY